LSSFIQHLSLRSIPFAAFLSSRLLKNRSLFKVFISQFLNSNHFAMHFTSLAAAAILATTAVSAAPVNEKRQSNNGNFGLSIGEEGLFNLEYLQTYKLSYANNSAFVGQIKYQPYSEPLVVNGAMVAPDTEGGLGFLSEHSAPTGYQYGYIMPGQSAPLQFTVPHTGGEAPEGASLTGFSFSGGGPLLHNGKNKFFACQSPNEAAINTYQIWWLGGPNEERPLGADCLGPIGILESDPCARGN
jgi:hypothetical protein